jgi:F0F1-type ATP synthase assembly protein I
LIVRLDRAAGDKTSLWVRNVQLCIFSIPLQLFAVWQRDWGKVQSQGWLHGFCPVTWAVVCMFAFGAAARGDRAEPRHVP